MTKYTGVISDGSKTLVRGVLVDSWGVRDFAQAFGGSEILHKNSRG